MSTFILLILAMIKIASSSSLWAAPPADVENAVVKKIQKRYLKHLQERRRNQVYDVEVLVRTLNIQKDDVTSLYGIEPYYRDEFYHILSPALAHSFLTSGMFRYLYRRMDPDIPRSQLGPIGRLFRDDPVIHLIHRLFHMTPGDDHSLLLSVGRQRRAEDAPTQLSFYLGPSTIGKLLEAILVHRTEDAQSLERIIREDILPPNTWEPIATLLTAELSGLGVSVTDGSWSGFLRLQKDLERQKSRMEAAAKKLDQPDPRIVNLREGILILNRSLDPYKAAGFSADLSAALKACREPGTLYPSYFPVRILISFVLLKSRHYRQTLLDMWQHTPGLISSHAEGLIEGNPNFSESRKRAFLNRTIQRAEWEHEVDKLIKWIFPPVITAPVYESTVNLVRRASHPDDTLALHRADNFWAPLLNQSAYPVSFKLGEKGQEIKSSDCCEAAFFNIFLGNASLLDRWPKLDMMRKAWESPSGVNPKDLDLRGRWKELLSNIPGASYYEQTEIDGKIFKYHLQPSVDNFLAVAEHLLDIQDDPTLPKPPRKHRLARFCSRWGCEIAIFPDSEPYDPDIPWTNVSLIFKRKAEKDLAGQPSLIVDIKSRHCYAHYENIPMNYFRFPLMLRIPSLYSDYLPEKSAISVISDYKIAENEKGSFITDEKYEDFPITRSEQESMIQILGSDLSLGDWDAPYFGHLVGWMTRKGGDLSILPILLGPLPGAAEDGWLVIRTIFRYKLTRYYPLALSMLMLVPFNEARLEEMAWVAEDLVSDGVPENLVCEFREWVRKLVTRRGMQVGPLGDFLEKTKSSCR